VMFSRIFQSIASYPLIYDLIQVVLGSKNSQRRVAKLFSNLPAQTIVLDVGGGTGIFRNCVPANCQYTCVDYDPSKVKHFHQKYGLDAALVGDGTKLPFASASIDRIMCIAVCHHLTDPQLSQLFSECMRLLKPDGRMILLDPVWNPDLYSGRLLWTYDRGSFPRTVQVLEDVLSHYGQILQQEIYTIWHTYLLCCVAPKINLVAKTDQS
jgi:ubiquinone/menaquinone biosynthesis C-methylase UbiE